METEHTPSALAWFLARQKLQDADEAEKGKVVLNDECGDSLWDEVLAQNNTTPKSSNEDKEIKKP